MSLPRYDIFRYYFRYFAMIFRRQRYAFSIYATLRHPCLIVYYFSDAADYTPRHYAMPLRCCHYCHTLIDAMLLRYATMLRLRRHAAISIFAALLLLRYADMPDTAAFFRQRFHYLRLRLLADMSAPYARHA